MIVNYMFLSYNLFEVIKMDTISEHLTRWRLLKISEFATSIQNAFGGDPDVENYCREIWDATAALNCIVDNLCTKI